MKEMTSTEDMSGLRMNKDLIRMTMGIAETWMQVGSHLMSMSQTMINQNLAAAEKMRHCQSMAEMYDMQLNLARQAYDGYIEEARKLGQIMGKMSSDAMEGLGR